MLRAFRRKPHLVQQGKAFQDRLAKVKSGLGETDFPWYPYDSFGNLCAMEQLLHGPFRQLLKDAEGSRVLDIGCADGDLSFFLESLGFRVTAIDYPETNHNDMRGIHKLKEALKSKIEILTADIDSRCDFPEGPFDLVICLGILYHLKNPYHLLERLAGRARFCLLSTRVARVTPDGLAIRDTPIAYLLGADELNQDWTNYWIFSEAGLKRLVVRTGWEVCSYLTVGDTRQSLPHTQDHDERAFCLIRNRRQTDPGLSAHLLYGWHELEDGRWRWTERAFAVAFPTADLRTGAVLELEFVFPKVLKERAESLQVQAAIGDTALGALRFHASGEQIYRAPVPLRLLRNRVTQVRFELDHALPPDSRDRRERGIIVLSVGLH